MVDDEKTGECYRADKILEDALDVLIPIETDTVRLAEMKAARAMAGSMNADELATAIHKWCENKAANGNTVSAPRPFNLMFKSQIGPQGDKVGYLRPETAQVMCVRVRVFCAYFFQQLFYCLLFVRVYLSTSSGYITLTTSACHLLRHKLDLLSETKLLHAQACSAFGTKCKQTKTHTHTHMHARIESIILSNTD